MIVLAHLSDDFLEDLLQAEFDNYKNFFSLLRELILDNSVFFVGDKNYILKLKKKYKSSVKSEKNINFLYHVEKKSGWLNLKQNNKEEFLKKNNIPVDFFFCSKEAAVSDAKYNINTINEKSKIIKKQIDNLKYKFFNIKLVPGEKSYVYNKKEIEIFKQKILKVVNISDKILIWDQYISSSLARINKFSKKIEKHKYYNDYCNTLRFLEDEIFSKVNKNFSCEILTMNKLETDWYFDKSKKYFNSLIQDYVNKLLKIKGAIYVKKMEYDSWDIKHARLMLFKDNFNQLIAYCVVESGMDFIKKGKKISYGKEYRPRKYTFTPGAEVNFDETKNDIEQINSIKGEIFRNVA